MKLRADFTTTPSGFPLTAGTLDFMQRSYTETVQAVAAMAGATNVIISGCVRTGDLISAGVIYAGGELLFFVGGDAGATTRLKSEVVAVPAENENGQDVDRYFTTTLVIDAAGDLDYNDLRRAGTLIELQRQAATLVSFEPAVIVEGCLVSGVTTQSVAISPGTYVLDGAFVVADAYQGNFPVYFNAQGYTNADPGGVRVAFDPYTSQRSADVLGRASTKRGTLVEVASDVLDQFDATTGLGKWGWKGYAIANGVNGTADLRGRFRVAYDASQQQYRTVGNTGGLETVTLTEAQMPRHAHGSPDSEVLPAGQFGLMRKSVAGENKTVAGTDPSQAGQEPDLTEAPIPIPPAGSNQAHENRPPFIVTFVAQRI